MYKTVLWKADHLITFNIINFDLTLLFQTLNRDCWFDMLLTHSPPLAKK